MGTSVSQFQHGAKLRSQFLHGAGGFLGPNIYIDSFKEQPSKLSGGTYPMGMRNVAGGEYSDFYIYHLVLYISYVFDRCTIIFIETYWASVVLCLGCKEEHWDIIDMSLCFFTQWEKKSSLIVVFILWVFLGLMTKAGWKWKFLCRKNGNGRM